LLSCFGYPLLVVLFISIHLSVVPCSVLVDSDLFHGCSTLNKIGGNGKGKIKCHRICERNLKENLGERVNGM
jgi:hypothetical protein